MSIGKSSLEKWFLRTLTFVFGLLIDAFVGGMVLYDMVVAPAFHLPTVNFWQALATLYLVHFLFGTFVYQAYVGATRTARNAAVEEML
jgi:hypothetical protein